MDIVVVEEVQDGVNILYCKLKVNDNTNIKVCQKMVCIYYIYENTTASYEVLNILSQHTELERVYIIIKNAAENNLFK